MIKIGQIGIGFMGKMHFDSYNAIPGAKVTAMCDVDAAKLKGDWSKIAGNIGGGGKRVNLKGIDTFANASDMLKNADIDVVDITLPTYLHAKYAKMALAAGKHVICEKPMARTSAEGKSMIEAAQKNRRQLYVAQCIRFWPAYAKAAEIVKKKTYGNVKFANFRRLSPTPLWSWDNWLMDEKKSGNAALDLHIHDADFVMNTFGKPKSISAKGAGKTRSGLDHTVATYHYAGNKTVIAEGGWSYPGEYPFQMWFQIMMEKAVLEFGLCTGLMLYPAKGKARQIKVSDKDGYFLELQHFLSCIKAGKASKEVTPKSALDSVRLIEAETKSAKAGGKAVAFK